MRSNSAIALRLRGLARCERGTAAVEFAIISVVFIMLLVGIVDFGRTLYIKNQLSYLADQTARAVLVDPSAVDNALETALRAGFTAGDPTELEVDFQTQVIDGITFKVLTLDYPVTLFIPNLASSVLDLNVIRRMPTG